ncbi:unnamed protein product [Boreogadus saida]
MSMLTCSGVRRYRSLVTVSPAAENTRSEGTDVAVMHKYLCANLATFHNPGAQKVLNFCFDANLALNGRPIVLPKKSFFKWSHTRLRRGLVRFMITSYNFRTQLQPS